jgi:cytochrome c-type biogenesis protein
MDLTFASLVALPIALGLVGFVEPCSLGSTLLFVKYLEGKDGAQKLTQVAAFAGARALFIGLLGALATVVGSTFLGFQKAAWVLLGAVYLLIGLLFLVGKSGTLAVSVGPRLAGLSEVRGSATLGVLFGLNIPACAAPLLFALLAAAAAGGSAGATAATGFLALALFGLALSLPLVAAVLFERARRALDWLAGLSRRLPFWTGVVLAALGLWSIWFGLFARIAPA